MVLTEDELKRSKQPKVFVIILSWNSAKRIRDCLDSFVRLQYGNYEVVVVDNGSTDASCEIIRSDYPSVHLIQNDTNLGYTGGNNVGIDYALANGADYIWLFNDDASTEENTLERLVRAMQSDAQLGMASPLICFRQQPERIQFAGSYLDEAQFEIVGTSQPDQMQAWMSNQPGNILLWGTALMVRADVIREIGALDALYFAYYEDSDLCIRAMRAGYRGTVVLTARILHESHQTTITRPPHFHYLMIRNEYRFWLGYLPAHRQMKFRRKYLSKTLKTLGRCKETASSEHVDACIAGLWDALCGVYGPRDTTRRMPVILQKILVWRPYFLAMLVDGDFRRIISQLLARLKKPQASG